MARAYRQIPRRRIPLTKFTYQIIRSQLDSGGTGSTTLNWTPLLGNYLVVIQTMVSVGQPAGITDSKSNTYTVPSGAAQNDSTDGDWTVVYYAKMKATGASMVLTHPANDSIIVMELAGIDPDNPVNIAGGTTAQNTTGTFNLSATGTGQVLLVGGSYSNGTTVTQPGANYAKVEEEVDNVSHERVYAQIGDSVTAGTITFNFTVPATGWGGAAIAFNLGIPFPDKYKRFDQESQLYSNKFKQKSRYQPPNYQVRQPPYPPVASAPPYASYWIHPVNEPQKYNYRTKRLGQEPQTFQVRKPSWPPLSSQAPYLSYFVHLTNQPFRSSIKRRQQPPAYPSFAAFYGIPAAASLTVAAWLHPVNQYLRKRTPKRSQPGPNTPSPLTFSEPPYISYWNKPTNQYLRKRIPKRQIPNKAQSPYPPITSQAPYLSYWSLPVNQFLSKRKPKRQQPQYPSQYFATEEVELLPSVWIHPVQQYVRKRTPKRQQPAPNAPPPLTFSEPPYVSYWIQPINQFIRKRLPKRMQINKFQPSYPPIASQPPYLSYFVHPINQPVRGKKRQQPPSYAMEPFYSIPVASTLTVSAWIHLVNEPLRNRVLRRQQPRPQSPPPLTFSEPVYASYWIHPVNEPQNYNYRTKRGRQQPYNILLREPSWPPLASQAPYISNWIHPINQFLRKRTPKRQQPQYPAQYFATEEIELLPSVWIHPVNQPLSKRKPKRQQPQLYGNFGAATDPALIIVPFMSWKQPVGEPVRFRYLKRKQPFYFHNVLNQATIFPPIFTPLGIIINSLNQNLSASENASAILPNFATISTVTDSASKTTQGGEKNTQTLNDTNQKITLQG